MKYTKLTDEQKAALDEAAVTQIEHDHYATSLALKRAEVSGDEAQIGAFRKSLADLEAQHKALTS